MSCTKRTDPEFIEKWLTVILDGDDPSSDLSEHLSQCSECQAEMRAHHQAFLSLGLLVPRLSPPTRLKARVMSMATQSGTLESPGQVWKDWHPDSLNDDLYVVQAEEGEWSSTVYGGIQVRRLFADPQRDRITMMVKMEPGSAYPPHVHGGLEECYVLSGQLKVGKRTLSQGDFQIAPEGSTHLTQASDQGCLLLISSSYHDELFALA